MIPSFETIRQYLYAPTIRLALFFAISLALLPAVCIQQVSARNSSRRQTSRARCDPQFPVRDGWLGGDAAYSIPIGADTSVWLFRSTSVAAKGAHEATQVSNSIAVSTCDETGHWGIEYHWRKKGTDESKGFFQPKEPGYQYRPMDGFAFGEKLYVVLLRESVKAPGSTDTGFAGAVDVAIILNYTLSPEKWIVKYVELSPDSGTIPGISVTVVGGFAYFYSLITNPKEQPAICLFREAVKYLDQGGQHLEYYSKDHKWRAGTNILDAARIFSDAAREFSVRYHEEARQFIAISGPVQSSDGIRVSTSDALTGPWSDWKSLYSIPVTSASSNNQASGALCHAALEHIEFYEPEQKSISVTYVCGNSAPGETHALTGNFRPAAIRLPLPGQNQVKK